jgi:hypothetical protein
MKNKKEEVQGIITRYKNEIHTITDDHGVGLNESNNANAKFNEYKTEAAASRRLTDLDAMIRRIQVFSENVLDRIHSLLSDSCVNDNTQKIISLRRVDIISPRRLSTREEIDAYVYDIRNKLYEALGYNDGIQIN